MAARDACLNAVPESPAGERRRWGAPWFAALRPMLDAVGEDALAGRWQSCLVRLNEEARARGLANANGLALGFVDARAVAGTAYERHVWDTGEVPTRLGPEGGWHDLFNALAWLSFPRTKARLNALQAREIARDGVGARRGCLRDAATLFDENAAIVLTANPGLVAALRGFDWQELLVRSREAFAREVRVLAFGHALIDKLRNPYKGICAHGWIVHPGGCAAGLAAFDALPAAERDGARLPAAVTPALDELLCDTLGVDALRTDAFAPLPVLGIPGWWPPNSDPSFYDDRSVFRSARRRASRI